MHRQWTEDYARVIYVDTINSERCVTQILQAG
jgi:hypothetical protein